MRRALLLAALFCFSFASAAGACPRRLLVPMPPHVEFVAGPAPGDSAAETELSSAGTNPETGTIYYTAPMSRFARAHEVGHLLDAQVLTPGDRIYFTRIMGVPGVGPWRRGTGVATGSESPSEWFADYYAAAAIHMNVRRGGVASYATVTLRRLERFSRALDRLGRRHGLLPYA